MRITDHDAIFEKAKVRKNGVYSHGEYLYSVVNNRATAYADWSGNLFLFQGSFHVVSGKCERHDRRKTLMKFIKESTK